MKKIYLFLTMLAVVFLYGCADKQQELEDNAGNIITAKFNEHIQENSSALHFKISDNEIFTISTGERFDDLDDKNFRLHQQVNFYRRYNALVLKLELVDIKYDFSGSDKCSVAYEIKETKRFLSDINGVKISAILPTKYNTFSSNARDAFRDKYYTLLPDQRFDYNLIYNSASDLEINTLRFTVQFKYDGKSKKWVSKKYNIYDTPDIKNADFLAAQFDVKNLPAELAKKDFIHYDKRYFVLPESVEILKKMEDGLIYVGDNWVERKVYIADVELQKRLKALKLKNLNDIDEIITMTDGILDFMEKSPCSDVKKNEAGREINSLLVTTVSKINDANVNKFLAKAKIVMNFIAKHKGNVSESLQQNLNSALANYISKLDARNTEAFITKADAILSFIKANQEHLPNNLTHNLNSALANYISQLNDQNTETFITKVDALLKFIEANRDQLPDNLLQNLSTAVSKHIYAIKTINAGELIYRKIIENSSWQPLDTQKHMDEICGIFVEHYLVQIQKSTENFFENSQKILLYMKEIQNAEKNNIFIADLIKYTNGYKNEYLEMQKISNTIYSQCRYADKDIKWDHFVSFDKCYKKIFGEKKDWSGVIPIQQQYWRTLYFYLTPETKYELSEKFLFSDTLTRDFFMKCMNPNCRQGEFFCKTCKNSKVCKNCNGSGYVYVRNVDGSSRSVSCSKNCLVCQNKPKNCPACFGRGYRLKVNVWQTQVVPQHKEFQDFLLQEMQKYDNFLTELKKIRK